MAVKVTDKLAATLRARGIALPGRKRPPKFRNKRCELDGYKFDSLAEMRRYAYLKMRQNAGEIRKLRVHPRFTLTADGEVVGLYEADFDYLEGPADLWVVEDVKSDPTKLPLYKLKRAIFLANQKAKGTLVTFREIG